MPLNESTVEDAAISWFEALGYSVGHVPELARGEQAATRDAFSDVVLVGRLRNAIEKKAFRLFRVHTRSKNTGD